MDRPEEAATECARAFQEDPLNLLGRVRFAQCLLAAGRQSDAFRELNRVLELDENLWFAHFILGIEQLRQGQLVKAISHAERASALAPWNPSAKGQLAAICRIRGDARQSEELLETLKAGPTYGTPLAFATFHMACSEIDSAADWTEKAIAERHPAIFFFLRAHAPDLLHSDRWPGLARLLNL